MDDEDLAGLIGRAKTGDPEAVAELRRLENDIRIVVRVRLPRALRPRFDSMDFVQSVWGSFLSGMDRREVKFKDSEQLRVYLIGMARNKVLEAERSAHSKKRDVAREEPLYVRRGNKDVARDVAGPDPTPSQNVAAADRFEQIIGGRTPLEAKVIAFRLEGLSFVEIAARTSLNERTVRRMIEGIRAGIDDADRP